MVRLAANFGITVLNTPGTIDADYRGEIKIILINHGKKIFIIERGMRVAQLIISKIEKVKWSEKKKINHKTKRKELGLGFQGQLGWPAGCQREILVIATLKPVCVHSRFRFDSRFHPLGVPQWVEPGHQPTWVGDQSW